MHNLLLDCGVDSVNSTPLSRIYLTTLLPLQGLPLFGYMKIRIYYEEGLPNI